MTNIADLEAQQVELERRFRVLFQDEPSWGLFGRASKRALDAAGASLGLLILSVPFLLIAAFIKLETRGPVFFAKARVGRGGHLFRVWKFRTMVDNAISLGSGYTVSHNDARITRLGHFLRAWSIDELPQLWNVLVGDMSLVGPRPSWPHEVLALDDIQFGKIRVRPGVTGLAAVSGRNRLPWEKRLEYDNWYIDHWSFWLDLKVLSMTPLKVVAREGIYGAEGVNPSIAPHPDGTQEDGSDGTAAGRGGHRSS